MSNNFLTCSVVYLSVYSPGFLASVEYMGRGDLRNLVGWWVEACVNTREGAGGIHVYSILVP